jgi:ketosteroid isomerase-like protein
VHFATEEVAVAGDLAYEHGTYTLKSRGQDQRKGPAKRKEQARAYSEAAA